MEIVQPDKSSSNSATNLMRKGTTIPWEHQKHDFQLLFLQDQHQEEHGKAFWSLLVQQKNPHQLPISTVT